MNYHRPHSSSLPSLLCLIDQLREGGLQLDFLVESMFEKNILDAISIYERVCTDNHQVHELEEITVSVRTGKCSLFLGGRGGRSDKLPLFPTS